MRALAHGLRLLEGAALASTARLLDDGARHALPRRGGDHGAVPNLVKSITIAVARVVGEATTGASTPGTVEDRFRGLLEAAPDAMVIVDDAGRLLAEPLSGQGSHMLGALRYTNGFIRVEADSARPWLAPGRFPPRDPGCGFSLPRRRLTST